MWKLVPTTLAILFLPSLVRAQSPLWYRPPQLSPFEVSAPEGIRQISAGRGVLLINGSEHWGILLITEVSSGLAWWDTFPLNPQTAAELSNGVPLNRFATITSQDITVAGLEGSRHLKIRRFTEFRAPLEKLLDLIADEMNKQSASGVLYKRDRAPIDVKRPCAAAGPVVDCLVLLSDLPEGGFRHLLPRSFFRYPLEAQARVPVLRGFRRETKGFSVDIESAIGGRAIVQLGEDFVPTGYRILQSPPPRAR